MLRCPRRIILCALHGGCDVNSEQVVIGIRFSCRRFNAAAAFVGADDAGSGNGKAIVTAAVGECDSEKRHLVSLDIGAWSLQAGGQTHASSNAGWGFCQ